MEKKLRTLRRSVEISNNPARPLGASAPVVLPVVVHIVHDNGPENISDVQVMTAIQHLNAAYANTGYYGPSDGVDTKIQFCLAERDPDNNPTNGITRDVSPYTVMSTPADPTAFYDNDQHVKNVRRWNPLCYINIWVVKTISVYSGGYSSLPAVAGTDFDGIVIQANDFGGSSAGDVFIIHEMGHYLGLYHTFQGGCTNTDCSVDGDQVCDTPPDASTAAIGCNQTMNSCSTDVLSGFATDQNDLIRDYMDYGNFDCMTVFTQGQSDRMNGFIQTVRASLLSCKSCMMPCPSPVKLRFALPAPVPDAGTAVTLFNSSSGASSYEWYVNGVLVSTAYNLDYTFPAVGSYAIKLVGKTGEVLCLEEEKTVFLYISCPLGGCVIAPPSSRDTCVVNTFQKKIGGTAFESGQTLQVDAAGNYLITGTVTGYGSGEADMAALKFDPAGHPLWAKAVGDVNSNPGEDEAITPDGSLYAVYVSGLYKLDRQGNLLWSRNYGNAGAALPILHCIALQDGNYLLGGYTGVITGNLPQVLMKVDGSGNVLWAKQYYINNNVFPTRILEDGNQYVGVALINSIDFLVFGIDKTTGALNWSKQYTFPSSTDARAYDIKIAGDRLLLPFTYSKAEAGGLSSSHQGVLLLDKQGGSPVAYAIDGGPGTTGFRSVAAVMADGTICFSYGPVQATDPPDARLARLNPDGTFVSAKRYVTGAAQALVALQGTADGGIVALGNSTSPGQPSSMYLLKTDSRLLLTDPTHEASGCTIIDEYPVISRPAVIVTDLPSAAVDITPAIYDRPAVAVDMPPGVIDYCSNAALCQTLKISGADSVCVSMTDTLVYNSGKEAGCGLPVQWKADPTVVKIVGVTDSTVRLLFLSAGVAKLYAMLVVNCKVFYDSMVVDAFRSPSGIDLGGDVALCKASTVDLHAGSGFASYQWQDGFADSVYTVWAPGTYFVLAQDYCGRTYGDTVNISVAPDISFDLGDTTVCRNDTLSLTAPVGFLQYTWSPDYGISALSGRTVLLYPARDTFYICTVVKARGCTLTDSIHISVRQIPEGFLRSGEAVCIDLRTIELHPSGDWAGYKWFDETTGSTVVVGSPGEYWLEVTDEDNCVGRDSIEVRPGVCNPGVYFPSGFTPDHNGRNDLFQPVVTVSIDQYYMAVYNRAGERVFETREYRKGWDGRYGGKLLPPGTFVWYAVYRIQGSSEKERTVRGTVLLIR
jgi:gliding motility-associated-like protein